MAQQKTKSSSQRKMVFQPTNYKLMALGLLLVIGGFTAMYMENEVSGFISLFISPIVIMAGYISVIFAIMIRPSPTSSTESGKKS
jgi:FtsH-binding integral membrane protein